MNINKVILWKEFKGDLRFKSILIQLSIFLIIDIIFLKFTLQIVMLKVILYFAPISFNIAILMTMHRENFNNLECLFATSLTCKDILFGKTIYVTVKTATFIVFNTIVVLLYGVINHYNIVFLYDGIIVLLIYILFILCSSYALCGAYWLVRTKYKKLFLVILCIMYYFVNYLNSMETLHMITILFATIIAISLFDIWLIKKINVETIIRRCSI